MRLSGEWYCLVHVYVVGIRLDVTCLTSCSINCVSRQLFLVHYHVSLTWRADLWNNVYSVHRKQLLMQISRSCKRNNSGTLKQFGPVFSKKWAKIKIQEQFSVRITSQTSLLINMSHDVSPTCLSVWLFNYPQNLPFFSLKSSLEFTLHCGKYISLSASPPIFWSKFHLCTSNFHDNFLVNCTVWCLCFFPKCSRQNNAKCAFQYTF